MTSFALSPQISITEYDLTAIIPAVATSPAAIGGVFHWGPVGVRMLVTSEADLVNQAGKPDSNNYETWFTAQSFLGYGSTLYVSRGANTTSTNSAIGVYNAIANTGNVANIVAQVTKNDTDYLAKLGTYDTNVLYLAKYPGAPGNSLQISVCDSANAFTSNVNLANATVSGLLSVNAGSNVATISATFSGNATITDATTMVNNAITALSVGDLIPVGNSTIGSQYVQISALSNTTSNTTTATATINFVNPYRLSTTFSSNTFSRYWQFYSVIKTAPGQSSWVTANAPTNPSNDELHVVVVDKYGYFSGTPGSILETYSNLSRATDAQNLDGTPKYYGTVLNGSKYIRWTNDRTGAVSANAALVANSTNSSVLNLTFTGGTNGLAEGNVAIQDITAAYDLFTDPEQVDIGLVMTGKSLGGVNGEQMGNYLIDNISGQRKDCVAFISPPSSAVLNNYNNEVASILAFRALLRSSSYGFLDSGYKQLYDAYNNVYRWVPLNGDMAGLCARTDYTNDPWWAPAGYNRGQLKNVIQLAFNPNKAKRDILFPNNVNPVVTFPNDGTVLYGDKTLQAKASAFDAINVRRLFIVLEKSIATAAKYFLWEFNDAYTQAQVRNMINPYLRTVKGLRGITDYLVKCDSTNNTADVINRDMLVCDIYIRPARAIRNIQLNFVATPEGVTFSEVQLPTL